MHGLSPCPPTAALPASCSFAHPTPQSATSLGLLATTLLRVLSIRLPISSPPTGLDVCFFFISLVVGLPYSLIFCQFWLFFVFKLLSFFWFCEEAQCVYLCPHLGRKSDVTFLEYCSITCISRPGARGSMPWPPPSWQMLFLQSCSSGSIKTLRAPFPAVLWGSLLHLGSWEVP